MTLKELFTNIANAIRSATGTTGKIKASDFAAKINAIPFRKNGTNTSSSGRDNEGAYFYIPYGYYPEYANGKAWVRSDQSQITNVVSISVASKFEQRNYENGFYAELDLGSVKTCYSAQAFSGDSEGSRQYVTPQYWSNNAWVNYTGGTVVTRYWRGQMVGGQHIGNFASVLVAYTN